MLGVASAPRSRAMAGGPTGAGCGGSTHNTFGQYARMRACHSLACAHNSMVQMRARMCWCMCAIVLVHVRAQPRAPTCACADLLASNARRRCVWGQARVRAACCHTSGRHLRASGAHACGYVISVSQQLAHACVQSASQSWLYTANDCSTAPRTHAMLPI